MNNKIIITTVLTTSMTAIIYGAVATVQELRNKEQELYDKLVEHWIDKEGSTHLGNKELDPKAIQFSFSKNIMDKQTIPQIRDSMNTPLKKFTPEQQQDFKEAVKPELDELADVRLKLKMMRDDLDTEAERLAKILGKTKDDILKLADTNLTTLIKTEDPAKKLSAEKRQEALLALETIKKLRPEFGIKTVAAPVPSVRRGTTTEEEAEEGAGTAAKPSRVTAAAAAVAETKTKLSSIIKAASEVAIYAPCQDIHFDIIEDEEGIKFLRLIK